MAEDRETAWRYAEWKYDIGTPKLPGGISYDPTLGTIAMTSHAGAGNYCRLGPDAFTRSENICASVMGHENVHGGQTAAEILFYKARFVLYLAGGGWPSSTFGGPRTDEVEAYQWEINHQADTVTDTDATYIADCLAWRKYYNCEGPHP